MRSLATWAPWAAVAAATLFAVHVGNTEVGNYISARSESLSAAGLLGGLLLYMATRRAACGAARISTSCRWRWAR